MRFFKDHGLSIVLLLLFALSLVGQIFAGFGSYNEDRVEKHLLPLSSISQYLASSHFASSLSENMESEFLQMALFVLLTVYLYQKGSAESKKPPEQVSAEDRKVEQEEKTYREQKIKKNPILWRLYENSLVIALVSLFLIFFFFHAYGSLGLINEQKQHMGEPLIGFWQVFAEQEFWFESFQNWQSEFFSIFVLGVFSIFLRQKGSPQSKKLQDPHWKTGSD